MNYIHVAGYNEGPTPNTETFASVELLRERKRNRSLRKMLVAQTIYSVLVTAVCVAVMLSR